jgi:hypothetical protein
MKTAIFVALVITLIGVVVVMGLGTWGMARGGAFAKKYGNRLMQMRVALQALALALFAIALLIAKNP